MEKIIEDWVKVCRQCTHCYTTKDDPDTLKCRCRKKCKFEDAGLKERKRG
jgi:hypothetical protein